MALSVQFPEWNAVSAALVARYVEEIAQRLEEADPNLDARNGVVYALLVYYNAVLAARMQEGVRTWIDTANLGALLANPETASEELVDHVTANFLVQRKAGAQAVGVVRVVVNRNVPVSVAQDAVFVAAGQQFLATQAVIAVPDFEFNQLPGTQLLRPEPGNLWSFTVPVIASQPGAGGMIKRGTAVVPVVAPFGYVRAYAEDDFIGGNNPETNAQVLQRVATRFTAPSLSNRLGCEAWLRSRPEAASVLQVSIVGFGDPEMLRDRDGLWPGSQGGKSDWYVRTSPVVLHKTITREATLQEKLSDNTGLWQIGILRTDAPGFYEASVLPLDEVASGSLDITTELRLVDTGGAEDAPYLNTPQDAAFSAYQGASVVFHDPSVDVSTMAVGTTREYRLVLSYLPMIGALQDAVLDRDAKPLVGDVLIRAAVPCMVRVVLTLHAPEPIDDTVTIPIRQAVADAINETGFTGVLYASDVLAAARRAAQGRCKVAGMDWVARIKYPNGTQRYVPGDLVLTVPDEPESGVSKRTVQFFCDLEAVTTTAALV